MNYEATSETVSSSAYSVGNGTSSGKCSSLAKICSVSTNQELPTSSSTTTTASLTLAATPSSNYGSGVIIPIQPFEQTASNTQGCYQNMLQLQPNIVQFQSQPIQPIFQQISPIQIQNQLIPMTIYQAGNQALFSNYSYIDPGRGQSVNFQAQLSNSSENQSQLLSSNYGRNPIHRHESTMPPSLLVVPKPNDMPELKNHVDQPQYQRPLASPVMASCSSVKTASPKSLASIPKSQQQSVTQCSTSVNCDSHETSNAASRMKDTNESNTTLEGASDAIDDEIKNQMEELDREIQRKEQEQEQMKLKKSKLLEKMKQAKSAQPAIHVENDKSEIELRELHRFDQIQNAINDTNVVAIGKDRVHFEDGYVDKEAKRSCEDVVLSESVEDTRDGVIGSDIPIDLSSSIKSSQIIRLTDENLTVTVSNGVISIKERNTEPSLSPLTSDSMKESRKSLKSSAEKIDSVFSDIVNKESVLSGKYVANQCDGINYIEDIGMVNPFTGEYDINVDSEEWQVEYLDLSINPDADSENKLPDDPKENMAYKELESAPLNDVTFKQVGTGDNTVEVCFSKVYERKDKELDMKEESIAIESQLKLTKSIESSDNVIIQALTSKPEIEISSSSSLTSSITNVSGMSSNVSTITCSVVQSLRSPITSTEFSMPKTAPIITHTRSSNSLAALVDSVVETRKECCISDQLDEPLNLEKTKVAMENANMFSDQPHVTYDLEKIKIAVPEKGIINLIGMDTMYSKSTNVCQYPLPLQSNTNAECGAKYSQSPIDLTYSDEEANMQLKNAVDHSKYQSRYANAQRLQAYQKQKNQMLRSNLVTATDISLIQLAPLNLTSATCTISSKQSLKLQNQRLTDDVSGTTTSCNPNHEFVNNQNETLTSGNLMAPMVHQRKAREKIMEIKPAHYRSPPLKVQRSAKPSLAHGQKSTSLEELNRMSILPINFPVPVKKTSPYISMDAAVFVSPKEVDNPIPKQCDKRPPKPAHNKRPFGIAGHLIVQSAKKNRKRSASRELVLTPQYYSLPNTPTSYSGIPPRTTSVDSHGNSNSNDLPADNQGHVNPAGNSASPLKMKEHHGAHVALPVPIKAHCRPKSLIYTSVCNKFYETSVLRPPALLQNVNCPESSAHVEVIDLTSDIVTPILVSNEVTLPLKTTKSKENAIQQGLNHSEAKRQRIEHVERNTSQMRHDGSIYIRPQQRSSKYMRPPPPYTGRQRMPVLSQVPRRPSVEEQRLAYEKGVELRFEEGRRLVPHLSGHGQSDMHWSQNQDPQTSPQRWSPQYVGHESQRRYGAREYQSGRHTKGFIPGNEAFITSQQKVGMVTSKQRFYGPRHTMHAAGSATNGQPVRRLDQYTGKLLKH